jgi:hypothetical protein
MYDAAIGRFFKHDRFAEKYFPLSPYNYTANNPLNFIDLNGDYIIVYGQDEDGNRYSVLYENGKAYHYSKNEDGKITKGNEYDGENEFIERAVSDLRSIGSTEKGADRINDLQKSKSEYGIHKASVLKSSRFSFDENASGGGDIYYFQGGGFLAKDRVSYDNSSFALGHELQHAWDRDQGKEYYFTSYFKGKPYTEKNAVEFENYLRAMAGEKVMRVSYNGTKLFNNSSPNYFKNIVDPLKKTEDWYVPPSFRNNGSDATYVAPNYKAIRRDTRTGKFVTD